MIEQDSDGRLFSLTVCFLWLRQECISRDLIFEEIDFKLWTHRSVRLPYSALTLCRLMGKVLQYSDGLIRRRKSQLSSKPYTKCRSHILPPRSFNSLSIRAIIYSLKKAGGISWIDLGNCISKPTLVGALPATNGVPDSFLRAHPFWN